MTNFFTESMMTKQQRKHIAHNALVIIIADFIAAAKFDKRLTEADYVDAFTENMSIKLGSVERATIVEAYHMAIANAKARKAEAATRPTK